MRSLSVDSDAALAWVGPSIWRRRRELWAGDETVATMAWQKRFRSTALATTDDGGWAFERTGFWPAHVLVRRAS